MNILLFVGVILLAYIALQFLFMKNRKEIERLEFIVLVIPIVGAIKDYLEIKPTLIEMGISLGFSYLIMFLFVALFIRLVGIPLQANCEFTEVVRLFDRDKTFKKEPSEKNNYKLVFKDKDGGTVKLSRRNARLTNVTVHCDINVIWAFRREIVQKIAKLDKGISKEYYINGLLGGVALVGIGLWLSFR